ncbi:FdhF/YdeP family oxidoreductase [Nocardioides guangzhouensis]|uniref:FdhF/YdeP family oxidoreductase n=1 Tax=Nocardioides guangzhouensis TaxID=2497878 RepID=A0A4Q4Z5X2_9ACTN|nr:FdhF/YdeP family oxidoreductase [Nocardioides guangzhouensis]RYP82471.1 FdhF/YdeP family oxidoreductase [Nocardioides guangzhouensis]
MARRAPDRDIDEAELEVDHPKDAAAGLTAVGVTMKRAVEQMGVRRTARTLLRLNQADGFDCQGCAWPDPDPGHRHTAEFCENGAKAVTEEATLRRIDRDFFARHSLEDLAGKTDYWLGQQGRLTEPMVRRRGATHYQPISWDDAFAMVAEHLGGLGSPDEAVFYTSGRTSNEAAFAYQLFVRAFGTNNMPDCSNMCHESTSVALAEVIGIGKGSVHLEDVHRAELIVIVGQNPGTNHPRMLSALEIAKKNGAKIIAVNPLREAGLVKFRNPQTARGLSGVGTELADLHLPVRVNGDLALFQAIGSLLVQWDALDHDFIDAHTTGFEEWAAHVRDVDWAAVERATGLDRALIEEAAGMFRDSSATVLCWAMGITQHRNAVATIKEFANVTFAQGNIGKPGAGLCPVRGHSNVQGDRTMGIWERPPAHFLDALQAEFGFDPPREHGYDTVEAIRALRDGKAKTFFALGGNFVSAAPDTHLTEDAMRNAALTVQVSTKLNRSHAVTGDEALILPTLGRSERDRTGGHDQRVTVEDSMSAVHASRGPLKPASPHLRSEVDIVCSLAQAVLGDRHGIPWTEFRADYAAIRRRIANVVPGCAAYDEKVDQPGGFVLPHPPRDSRTFPTTEQKAIFTASPIDVLHVPEGRLLMQTLRSHDQFNTTIYGLDDRYRGISNGRRVVFVHPDDITALGLAGGQVVDLVSEWTDGSERRAPAFRVVAYEQPRGCAAAYYPETNPLVPLDSTAVGSNCPTSKSIIVRLEPELAGGGSSGHGGEHGQDEGHKSRVAPEQLS